MMILETGTHVWFRVPFKVTVPNKEHTTCRQYSALIYDKLDEDLQPNYKEIFKVLALIAMEMPGSIDLTEGATIVPDAPRNSTAPPPKRYLEHADICFDMVTDPNRVIIHKNRFKPISDIERIYCTEYKTKDSTNDSRTT